MRRRSTQHGFAAIVIVMLAIMAALTVAGLILKGQGRKAQQTTTSSTSLQKVKAALTTYQISHAASGVPVLPCPDTTGTGQPAACAGGTAQAGLLPWAALGLSKNDSIDAWGNPLVYVATTAMTAAAGSASGAITVNDYTSAAGYSTCTSTGAATATTSLAYVVISYGPNGRGAYRPNSTNTGLVQTGGTAVGSFEPGNVVTVGGAGTSATAFNIAPQQASDCAAGTNTVFDDLLVYDVAITLTASGTCTPPCFSLGNVNPNQLTLATANGGANATLQLANATTGAAIAAGQSAAGNFNFGQLPNNSNISPNSPVPDLGGNRAAACTWGNSAIPFTTQRLSAFIVFQMGQGETDITQAGGTADGFTLTLIPGAATTTASTCGGDSGNGMGYANTGLAVCGDVAGCMTPPNGIYPLYPAVAQATAANNKMAIVFDDWNTNSDGFGTDPGLNHVGILRGDEALNGPLVNAASTNYSVAPGCPNPNNFNNTPAVNGAANWGCTWRLNQPAWLETRLASNGNNVPAYSSTSPPVVTSRIDMWRQCNSTCSSCSNGSGNYMKIQVWADCSTDTGLDTACQNISKPPSDASNTALTTPLVVSNSSAALNGFTTMKTYKANNNNPAYLTIDHGDFTQSGLQVGDYVNFQAWTSNNQSGNTTDSEEFTISAITATQLTAAYNQSDSGVSNRGSNMFSGNTSLKSFTLTRLTNTISACLLEPNAAANGYNANSNYNTVKWGLTISNGANFALRVQAMQINSYTP